MYLAQGQYLADVGIEPRTSRSTVLCSRSIARPPQNICWLFVKYKSFVFFSHVGTKRIYDGVEAETRKSQASFQIIQVSSEALPRMRLE